ncbi:metal ABC transporter solute-binding protein, Zn/Mn family, partial [Ectothiorhodospira haloalkaliphila]
MYKWLIGLVLLVSTATAQAAVNVVATTPAMGMLAETVGGDAVSVRVLAPADRDAHYLQARPSMMAALRGA